MPGRLTNIFFTSTEQTGSGSSQAVPHGLGRKPRDAWIEGTDILAAETTYVLGTIDDVNINVTATSGAKYKVHARV